MGRRKEERYRFYPADQEVKIPDNIKQHDILMIVNANDGIIIANQLDPGKGFTCSHTPTPVTDDADFIYSTDCCITISRIDEVSIISNWCWSVSTNKSFSRVKLISNDNSVCCICDQKNVMLFNIIRNFDYLC